MIDMFKFYCFWLFSTVNKKLSKNIIKVMVCLILCINVLSISTFSTMTFLQVKDINESVKFSKANAASFDGIFKTFGEELPDYTKLTTWSGVVDEDDLAQKIASDSSTTPVYVFEYVSHNDSKQVKVKIKTNMNHINMAKDITENITAEAWASFIASAKGKVNVDSSSKSVSRSKSCTKADYKELKSIISTITNDDGMGDFISEVYSKDKLKIESNEMTELMMSPFYKITSMALYFLLVAANIASLFFAIVDLNFLLNPIVRGHMLNMGTEDLKGSKLKRYKLMCRLVSPAAINACNCVRDTDGEGNTFISIKEGELGDIKWFYWMWRRAWMVIAPLTFVVLLFTGLISTCVMIASKGVAKVLNSLFNYAAE